MNQPLKYVYGQVAAIGDDDDGQSRLLIYSTRSALKDQSYNLACTSVAVLPEDLLWMGQVYDCDASKHTLTLRFEDDAMPPVTVGETLLLYCEPKQPDKNL
ncbi:MAG: hypothetical protein KGI71_05580 [Patescibacteria group bacterium]|nr:hypothetical protein [Patescibacteria group bacterium]